MKYKLTADYKLTRDKQLTGHLTIQFKQCPHLRLFNVHDLFLTFTDIALTGQTT